MILFATGASLTVGLLFWLLFIIGLVFYGWDAYRTRIWAPHSLFWWVLIFLLGCGVFGFPIAGM